MRTGPDALANYFLAEGLGVAALGAGLAALGAGAAAFGALAGFAVPLEGFTVPPEGLLVPLGPELVFLLMVVAVPANLTPEGICCLPETTFLALTPLTGVTVGLPAASRLTSATLSDFLGSGLDFA